MYRWATALVALVALACACGSSGNGAPSEGPAGVVVEVDGTVVASRADGSERALSADAVIYADDTVTTGGDGFVKIRLTHNGAVLALSRDKKRTLRDSAAWKATEGSDEIFGDGDDDRTAIAGRQGEKAAGESGNTVREVKAETPVFDDDDDVQDNDDDGSQDDGKKGDETKGGEKRDETKNDDKKRDDRKRDDKKPDPDPQDDRKKSDDTTNGGGGGGGGGCDEVACLLADKPMPCCSNYKKTDPKKPSGNDLADKPSRGAVKKVIDKLIPKVKQCGAKVAATVRWMVKPDGSVGKVSVKGPVDTAVIDCIKKALRSGVFPKSKQGTPVKFIFKK